MEAGLILPVAFAGAAAGTRIAMALGRRLSILDWPAQNKLHAKPVPRIGGLGIAVGLLAGWSLLIVRQPGSVAPLAWLAFGAAAAAAVGLADDIMSLTPMVKLAGTAIAAAIPIAGGLGPASPLAALAAWAFIVFLCNAVNLLDGLDGLAGCVALISALAFWVMFSRTGQSGFALGSLALAAALLGFLLYNLPPARTFMGDAGSLLLGYVLGTYAVALAGSGPRGALPAIIILALPIADTVFVICRRIWRRQRVTTGGLDHTYNLAARIIGQPAVLCLFSAASLLLAALAVMLCKG